jgi:hypothetical protein
LNYHRGKSEAGEQLRALADAVYADCASRSLSDEARLFVNSVINVLEEHNTRKHARSRAHAAKFALTVEGFLGDLMLARDRPAAAGWVFRPLYSAHFTGSGTSYAHFAAALAGLELIGLIERAPNFQQDGAHRAHFNVAPRFRATFKLNAMAQNAGIDPYALGNHFGPSLTERTAVKPKQKVSKRLGR